MRFLIDKFKNLLRSELKVYSFIKDDLETLKVNSGKALGDQNLLLKKDAILHDIHQAEFKVFSQWGDDGIINFLINYLDIPSKRFIEFGVENYTECNTRFLLVNDNWSGLIIDGSDENMKS